MTNVQFIIQYLSEYPSSRYTDITKALCAWKGKRWTRGFYCRYFITNPVAGITITQPENLVHQWFIPTTFGEKVHQVDGISHARDMIELIWVDYKISGPV